MSIKWKNQNVDQSTCGLVLGPLMLTKSDGNERHELKTMIKFTQIAIIFHQ